MNQEEMQRQMAALQANFEATSSPGAVVMENKAAIQVQETPAPVTSDLVGDVIGSIMASSAPTGVVETAPDTTNGDDILSAFGITPPATESAAAPSPDITQLQQQLAELSARLEEKQSSNYAAPDVQFKDFDSMVEEIVSNEFAGEEDLDPDVVRSLLVKGFKPIASQMEATLAAEVENRVNAAVSRIQEEMAAKTKVFDEMATEKQQQLERATRDAFLDAAQQKLADHVGNHKVRDLVARNEFAEFAASRVVPGTSISYRDALNDAFNRGNVEDFSVLVRQLTPKPKSLSTTARPTHVGGGVGRGGEAADPLGDVSSIVRRGTSGDIKAMEEAYAQTVRLLQAYKPT